MARDYHQTVEGDITPMPESILIHNLETTDERVTTGGLIVLDENKTGRGIRPRWAQVWKIGEEIEDVKVGEWILLEHGRWTRGINLKNGNEETIIRMVDRKSILGTQDEQPEFGGFGEALQFESKEL